jgi:hypothetical protein
MKDIGLSNSDFTTKGNESTKNKKTKKNTKNKKNCKEYFIHNVPPGFT